MIKHHFITKWKEMEAVEAFFNIYPYLRVMNNLLMELNESKKMLPLLPLI